MADNLLGAGGINPLDPQSITPAQTPGEIGAESAKDFGNIQVFQPADAAEKVARKNGWRTFLQRLQTDEGLRKQLFITGTELLRPIQPGQTAKGNIATALQKGVAAGEGVGEKARQAGLEERLVTAKEKTAARSGVSGGVAGRVQEINQMRDALQASDPLKYPKTPTGKAKATLAAQKLIRLKSREERITRLTGDMLLSFGNDIPRALAAATEIVDGAAAGGGAETPAPLPASKKDLIDRKLYNTSKGPGRWNAANENFDPV